MSPDEAVQAIALVVTTGLFAWSVAGVGLAFLARVFREAS